MTSTRQHIADLDVETWAALTRRAATEAVDAAKRCGQKPPAELVAVAAMTERELIERRNRHGPAAPPLSPRMQVVQAEHLREVAEGKAWAAHELMLDAEEAASLARIEAGEAENAAKVAREQARTAETKAARKEAELASAREAHERELSQLRDQLEKVRADAAAEVAAACEEVVAAEGRADARAGERTAERAAQEQAMQQLRGELEKVRADAAAEVAAAREQVAGAEARAEQRSAERAAERAAHEDALQRMRVDVEQARAYAEAEVAAALGWAAGDSAAARKAADTEIARARATAEDAIRRAQATAAAQFLSIPVAPLGVRVRMRQIENLLIAMHQIDYVLEVGMAEEVSSHMPLDIDLVRSAVQTVHETAFDFTAASRVDAAARYAEAAGAAFRAFLERIDTVVQQVRPRAGPPAAVILDAVVAMLADPRVVAVRGAAPSL